jgi:hypothetical protein
MYKAIKAWVPRGIHTSEPGVALSSTAAWPNLARSVIETFFTSCANELA